MRRAYTNLPTHYSEGTVTNPDGSTDLLADTGALDKGIYSTVVTAGASAAMVLNVQHRNAADSGNIGVVQIHTPADVSGQWVLSFNVAANERIRLLPDALTGTADGNIELERLE